jgi:hypothetical protein
VEERGADRRATGRFLLRLICGVLFGVGPRFLTEALASLGVSQLLAGDPSVPGGSPDTARGSRPTKPQDAGAASRSIDRRHRLTPLAERDARSKAHNRINVNRCDAARFIFLSVMAGLVPAIHVFHFSRMKGGWAYLITNRRNGTP